MTLVILRFLSLSTIISFFSPYSLHIPYSFVLWEFLLHLSSTLVHVPYDPARSEILRTEAIETITSSEIMSIDLQQISHVSVPLPVCGTTFRNVGKYLSNRHIIMYQNNSIVKHRTLLRNFFNATSPPPPLPAKSHARADTHTHTHTHTRICKTFFRAKYIRENMTQGNTSEEGLQCFGYDVETFITISGPKAQTPGLEMYLYHPQGNGTKLTTSIILTTWETVQITQQFWRFGLFLFN